MDNRTELMEAALEHMSHAVALLNPEGLLQIWNCAAEAVTGFLSSELLGRPLPAPLEPLQLAWQQADGAMLFSRAQATRGTLVHLEHKNGHPVNAMVHTLILRDGLGRQIGTAIFFHSTDAMESVPRGTYGGDERVLASQTEVEEQLKAVYTDFQQGAPPFGVLWIAVDQAPDLRKTHGAAAALSLMEKVERAISNGLRPGEALGRWGDDEFLVISHERTGELLNRHAQLLAGLARTADFRWWGDRISLTVSIGVARTDPEGTLAGLLESAKAAAFTSFHAGGNQITSAPGRQECLPS
jgi:diguanylate cyclase (GGDEF)-like protein/PAS domain S-box-containing protein